MKKVYTKPLAVMEDISLSENIAACDTNVSSSSANNASFSILDLAGFRHYFADDNCENKIDDPDNPFSSTQSGKKICDVSCNDSTYKYSNFSDIIYNENDTLISKEIDISRLNNNPILLKRFSSFFKAMTS